MLACSIDGVVCSPKEALIPVNDHGLLYGDGVFEGLRFYNGSIFRLQEHLKRLENSACSIALTIPMDSAALTDSLFETIDASGTKEGYIRLVVTRGAGSMGLDPRSCSAPRVIIIVDELAMVDSKKRKSGVRCIISSIRRLGADQLDPRIKSLNYLNQIMAKLEAHGAGADEAILLNLSGRVAEGTADNIFVVKDGELLTPPTTEGALDGVTRGVIIEIAKSNRIPFREVPLATMDLLTADECFLTGTGAELIPVAKIGDNKIGSIRPIFEILNTGFKDLVAKETLHGLPRPGTANSV